MSRIRLAMLFGVIAAIGLVAPAAASAVSISAGGSAYTGAVNVRLSSANAVLTTSTGTITCTSSSPRLGSFGTGAVTTSTLGTASATKGNISRLSFGNPLLANSSNTHDSSTTVLVPPYPTTPLTATPNSTPRCVSTISAVGGGCVAETNNNLAASSRPVNAYYAGTDAFIELNLRVYLYCKDNSGASVTCAYQTYDSTPGTPGVVRSNAIPFNTGSNQAAATAVFSSVKVYRPEGSTLCPATGTFTASYQLYTGTTYPGGSGVYVYATP